MKICLLKMTVEMQSLIFTFVIEMQPEEQINVLQSTCSSYKVSFQVRFPKLFVNHVLLVHVNNANLPSIYT